LPVAFQLQACGRLILDPRTIAAGDHRCPEIGAQVRQFVRMIFDYARGG